MSLLSEGHMALPDMAPLDESRKITFLFEKAMDLVNSSTNLPLLEKIKCSFEEVTLHLEEHLKKAAETIINMAQCKLSSSYYIEATLDEIIAFLSNESDLSVVKNFLDPFIKDGGAKKLLKGFEDVLQNLDWSTIPQWTLVHNQLIKDEEFIRQCAIHSDLGVLEYAARDLLNEAFILDLAEKVLLAQLQFSS